MPFSAWMIVPAVYVVMGLLTMSAYWRDKRAARRGRWRTRERTLHLLELVGGCIGGAVARHLFRHKTIDRRFRVISWLILALHAGAWVTFLILRKKIAGA